MKQADYIKQIAKFALANDNARLRDLLYQYVEYSQQNNRGKFATEILSIIKDSDRENSLGKLKEYRLNKHFDYKADEYILQTVTSSFTMKDLVCTQDVREEFEYFIKERQQTEALVQMDIPVSNKILLHGPSGCGKTLSAYVLAGELNRPLIIVNLGNSCTPFDVDVYAKSLLIGDKVSDTFADLENFFFAKIKLPECISSVLQYGL
jgi:SpoVK/Ycf46/Vps4 family AAA+-type ATPase